MQSRDLLFEPYTLSSNILCDLSHPNMFGFVNRENMHFLAEQCNV